MATQPGSRLLAAPRPHMAQGTLGTSGGLPRMKEGCEGRHRGESPTAPCVSAGVRHRLWGWHVLPHLVGGQGDI